MTPKTYFEELSYALRRKELLPRATEEDGLLPVEWNGRPLCRITESGAVRYDPTWVVTDQAKVALAEAAKAAGTVMEYTSRSSNAGASWIRSQPSCRKEPRIRCRAKVRSLDSPCEGGAKSGVAFFYTEIVGIAWFAAFFSLRMMIALSRQNGYCCGQIPTPKITRRTHV